MYLVTKEQLKQALAAASKDATRFNINGVHFKGGKLYATDGHRLNIVTPTTGGEDDESFTLARVDCEALIRAMSAKDTAEFNRTPNEIHVNVGASHFTFKPLDMGDYPDVDKVIPKGEPVTSFIVSAKYLKELASSVAALDEKGRRGSYPVRIEVRESLAPIKAVADSITVVLMPQRDPNEEK